MKISIITVNFNNLPGLQKTIKSVVSQTFTDFEFIIIDGGSTDGSVAEIKAHQSHVKYWVSEPDRGVFAAMNKGINKATSPYLIFLNSGDYFLNPTSLASVMVHPLLADITIADAKRLNANLELENYVQPDVVDQQFFYRYSLCHQAIIYKRSLFETIGYYNENLKIVADWEFNLKALIFKKCTYQHLNVPLVYYDNAGMSSTNIQLLNQERDQILSQLFSPAELKQFDKTYRFNHSLPGKVFNKLKHVFSL